MSLSFQDRANLRCDDRPAEVIALHLLAMMLAQERDLFGRFDAFGDDSQVELLAERYDRGRDSPVVRVLGQVGASAAWAMAEKAFITSLAPPRRFLSSALSSFAVEGQSFWVMMSPCRWAALRLDLGWAFVVPQPDVDRREHQQGERGRRRRPKTSEIASPWKMGSARMNADPIIAAAA
jgi:hypothetical protein